MKGAQVVQIVVRGTLGPNLVAALDGFEVTPTADGCTSIRGPIPDQARLIGLLAMFDELHIDVVSVNPVVEGIA